MYLSSYELSVLANRVITAYRKLPAVDGENNYCVDPVILAEHLLGLSVKFEHLSSDCRLLGMISFEPTTFGLIEKGKLFKTIEFDGKSIFIEKELLSAGASIGRKNFTIMHECAHWILKLVFPGMYATSSGTAARLIYERGNGNYSQEEWLADALASELLMPSDAIDWAISSYGFSGKVRVAFGDQLLDREKQLIRFLTELLGVSQTALLYRLKKLGYTEMIDSDTYWSEYEMDDCTRLSRRLETGRRHRKIDRINRMIAVSCKNSVSTPYFKY